MKQIYIILLTLGFNYATSAQSFTWTQKTAPPFGSNGRYDNASFTINDKIYIAGGSNYGLMLTYNDLWEYNPVNDSWIQKASMPNNGTYGSSAFVINGEGYVIGGWNRTGSNINQSYQANCKYNPVSNSWTQITAFPDNNRYTGVAFEINGKGYFGTGYNPVANDMWEYDGVNNSWTQKANFPGTARQAAQGFSIGNFGYLGLGGVYSNANDDLWMFDPVSNTWMPKASYPDSVRSCTSAFIINNEAYIIGGSDYNHTPFQNVYKYNPVNDAWTYVGLFPGGPRFCMSEASAGNKGYIGQGSYTTQIMNQYLTVNDWWEFSLTTGINETDPIRSVNVYPNPFNNELKFAVADRHNYEVIMLDVTSKKVIQQKFTVSTSINTEHLAKGIYIYEVRNKNGMIRKGKIVKE